MNVQLKTEKVTQLSDIRNGEAFLFQGETYMRTSLWCNEDGTIVAVKGQATSYSRVVSINLYDGNPLYLDEDKAVCLLKTEIKCCVVHSNDWP